MILDGIADIHITDDDRSEGRVGTARPGSFVYHPAYQHHTIRNRSDAPVTYLMFKWQSCPLEVEAPLQTLVCHSGRPGGPATATDVDARFIRIAESYLSKLHAHETVLQPGGGYAAHADEHAWRLSFDRAQSALQTGTSDRRGSCTFRPAHSMACTIPGPHQHITWYSNSTHPAITIDRRSVATPTNGMVGCRKRLVERLHREAAGVPQEAEALDRQAIEALDLIA